MDPSVRSFAPRATRPSPIVTSATAGPPNIHSPFRSSATALFGQEDSIWGSPLPEATRSAAMPDKAPWSGDVLRSSGLGINVGNKQQSFTPVTPSPLRLFHSTTPSSTHFPNNTYPLMQQEFGTPRQLADQPRLRGTPPSAATTTSSKMEDTDEFSSPVSIQPEVSPHHAAGSEVSPHDTEDGISVIGAISPHYLDTYPELAGQHAPVFRQATHPQGWKRVTTTPGARVDEAFKGAHEIVRGLNPDLFSMQYGTRVVNMKTDHVQNVHLAIQHRAWSTLDKVSRRIMAVWDSRMSSKEKVLFLFAVNGSKNYCGLAEMAGPYDPDASIKGWRGSGASGSIPLTWLYVKNIPYTNVSHITQAHNQQPVVNMWNGMKITSDTGRKVIEVYVKTPHFTNILAWLEGTAHHMHSRLRAPPNPDNVSFRGGRARITSSASAGDGGRHPVPAMAVSNWRTAPESSSSRRLGSEPQEDDELTPTHPIRPMSRTGAADPSSFNHAASGPGLGGFNMPCIANVDGTFTVVQNHAGPEHQAAEQLPIERVQSRDFFEHLAHDRSDLAENSRGRGRGRDALQDGLRGGVVLGFKPHKPKPVPILRESDFDRFRASSRDVSQADLKQPQGLDAAFEPTEKAHSTQPGPSHGLRHVGSADTIIPTNHLTPSCYERSTLSEVHPRPPGRYVATGHHHTSQTDPFKVNSPLELDHDSSKGNHSSYPFAMQEVDSVARYVPNLPELTNSTTGGDPEATYTRAIMPNRDLGPLVMENWSRKTPTNATFRGEQSATFYPPAVDKAPNASDRGRSLLSNLSSMSLRQQAEYYRILADKAEYEACINERFLDLCEDGAKVELPYITGINKDMDSRPCTYGRGGPSEPVTTMSLFEQHSVVLERNEPGKIANPLPTHHPQAHMLRPARTHSAHDSWDLSCKRIVDRLVNSPPPRDPSSPDNVSSGGESANGPDGGIPLEY